MKNKIKIYWCADTLDPDTDWNILYYKPTFLYDELKKNRAEETKKEINVFACPAFKDLTSKTIVIKNTISSHYKFFKENDTLNYDILSKNYMQLHFFHKPNFKNCIIFTYSMSFLLFSEEDINMTLTSPYFSNSPHLKYGSIIPGKYNISKWFRSINLEFNLWPNVDEFKIDKDEDIAYVNFDTENEIELIRFNFTKEIKRISHAAGTSSAWEKFIPLKERYERFKKSQMNKLLINKIKENIIE